MPVVDFIVALAVDSVLLATVLLADSLVAGDFLAVLTGAGDLRAIAFAAVEFDEVFVAAVGAADCLPAACWIGVLPVVADFVAFAIDVFLVSADFPAVVLRATGAFAIVLLVAVFVAAGFFTAVLGVVAFLLVTVFFVAICFAGFALAAFAAVDVFAGAFLVAAFFTDVLPFLLVFVVAMMSPRKGFAGAPSRRPGRYARQSNIALVCAAVSDAIVRLDLR